MLEMGSQSILWVSGIFVTGIVQQASLLDNLTTGVVRKSKTLLNTRRVRLPASGACSMLEVDSQSIL
jgi:hypothetical protein